MKERRGRENYIGLELCQGTCDLISVTTVTVEPPEIKRSDFGSISLRLTKYEQSEKEIGNVINEYCQVKYYSGCDEIESLVCRSGEETFLLLFAPLRPASA